MDKPRTVGQNWLANELYLHFLTLKKCTYQRPIQSVNSFKSYRANKLQIYRQTDTFAKTIFSGSEGLKTWTFDKNGGGGGVSHFA